MIGLLAVSLCATFQEHVGYLDNGLVKLGVNLDLGGAITYISKSGSDANVVNSADWGRQIQMSHYSGPIPFAPNGQAPRKDWAGLGWNPIQCGDCFGNRSKLVTYRNDGKSIYVKCIPMQWPLNSVPGECTFECWLKLEGKAVLVRSRMVNARTDHTQYEGRGQELPAVYTNGPWYRLMTYSGDKPFTHDLLSQKPPVFMWTGWQSTENWAALVDDRDYGLGIWNPGVYSFIGGFAGKPGAGGPKDGPTGYIAPVANEIIDHNIDYTYRYVLVLGQLEEIREYVYAHAKRPAPPQYRFRGTREHWIYHNATDEGWPIRRGLEITANGPTARLDGPDGFWLAKDAGRVVIEAAFDSYTTGVDFEWKLADGVKYTSTKTVPLKFIGDSKVRRYTLDLTAHPDYRDAITGISLTVHTRDGQKSRVNLKSLCLQN